MNQIEKVGAELIKLGGWVKHNFFKKSDYIITSRGTVDAGLPVLTNASGVLDSTLTGGGGGGGTNIDTLLTTKGDLVVRDNSAPQRMPRGSDADVLMTDSAQPEGLTWVPPSTLASFIDHSTLFNLDFASANHTGFVGANFANTITAPDAASVPVKLVGAASQTANMEEVQDNSANVLFAVGPGGELKTNQATTNTNTPSGATAKKLAVYNETGTLLGYIPIYGSAW